MRQLPDLPQLNTEEQKAFSEKVGYYLELGKSCLQSQSESFTAMDTKAGIMLALIGGLLAVVLSQAGDKHWVRIIESYPCPQNILSAFVALSYILLSAFSFLSAYKAIQTRNFEVGLSPQEFRELDNLNLSNLMLYKLIADSYEKAINDNDKEWKAKSLWYRLTERATVATVIFTAILLLFLTTI